MVSPNDGDLEALLVQSPFIRRVAAAVLGRDDQVDDVVQDTLVAAVLSGGPKQPGALRPWLATVARRLAWRTRRREGTRRQHESARPDPEPRVAVEEIVAQEETRQRLVRAVLSLDEPYRSTLVLRFHQGLSLPGVAEALGVSRETVKTRLRRGIALLRARLDAGQRQQRQALALLLPAGAGPGWAPWTLTTLGVGTMKKWMVAAALLALLGAGTWWIAHDTPTPEGPGGTKPASALTGPEDTEGGSASDPAGLTGSGTAADPRTEGAPTTPPHADGAGITGVVVDAKDRPVVGARIVAIPDTHRGTIPLADIEAGEHTDHTTHSDGEGRFAVPVDGTVPFHQVVVLAADHVAQVEQAVAVHAHRRIVLRTSVTWTGRVLDAEGNPVAGAQVKAWILAEAVDVRREVITDGQGRYRMPDMAPRYGFHWRQPSGGHPIYAWFEVRADGHPPLMVEFPQAKGRGDTRTFDFRLSPGAVVEGQVRAVEDGAPLAGAHVVLYSIEGMHGFGRGTGGDFSAPFPPRVLARTRTDASGRYRFPHVPSKGSHPSASHNSLADMRLALGGVLAWTEGRMARGQRIAVPEDGAQEEIALELWPAATVRGRVTWNDGTPVGSASVSVIVDGRGMEASLPKDLPGVPTPFAHADPETGAFAIHGAPAHGEDATTGQIRIFATAPGPRGAVPVRGGPHAVTFRVGETVDVGALVLERPAEQETTPVEVRGANGQPIFGATLARGHDVGGPRTDAQGRAAWPWHPRGDSQPWTPVRVLIRARGHAPRSVRVPPPDDADGPVEVQLEAGRVLRGQVVDAEGTPVPRAMVVVASADLPLDQVFPPRARLAVSQPRHARPGRLPVILMSTWTDDEGTFRCEDLPGAPWYVGAEIDRRVLMPDGPPSLRVVEALVDAPSAPITIQLPVDDSPPVGGLRLQVQDAATGSAPPSFAVELRQEDRIVAYASLRERVYAGRVRVGTATEDGTVELVNVPSGTYLLRTRAKDRLTWEQSVEVTAPHVLEVGVVALASGISVSGRATLEGDEDPARRVMQFRPEGRSPEDRKVLTTALDEDGTFTLSGLTPGVWRVEVHRREVRGRTTDRWLVAGDDPLVLGADDTERTWHPTLVKAGLIELLPIDKRLPPAMWSSDAATREQVAFGKQARLTLTGPGGKTILDRTGLYRHHVGPDGWQTLLPGRYVARLYLPGEEPVEEVVDLVAGTRVQVTFRGR